MISYTKSLISNYKYLLIKLDYLVANSFFYVQCQFTEMLKDIIISRILFLKSSFKITSGNENCQIDINTDMLIQKGRGNSLAKYSSSYELSEMPEIFNRIIIKHKSEIIKYLGRSFLYEKPICFRNFNYPEQFTNYDIFSNVWHQDSHDGNRLLKIFALPHNVSVSDGPFHYLDEKSVRKHWRPLRERWSFEKFTKKPSFPEEIQMTGEKNDYLILDSSRCMHRASNPKKHRDIIAITLYPRWRKKSDRKKYVFN